MTNLYPTRSSNFFCLRKLWLSSYCIALLWPCLLLAQNVEIEPDTGGAVIINGEVHLPDLSGTGTNPEPVCYDTATGQLTNCIDNNTGMSEPGVTGPATGPVGPAGADGPVGPVGPAGTDGAIGPTGPAGADGAVGPAGLAGPAGADGAIGPTGPTGADGAVGPAGADGATGPVGPAGTDGTVGPTGPAGANGAVGPTGPAGAVGLTGAIGPAGATGAVDVYNQIQGTPEIPAVNRTITGGGNDDWNSKPNRWVGLGQTCDKNKQGDCTTLVGDAGNLSDATFDFGRTVPNSNGYTITLRKNTTSGFIGESLGSCAISAGNLSCGPFAPSPSVVLNTDTLVFQVEWTTQSGSDPWDKKTTATTSVDLDATTIPAVPGAVTRLTGSHMVAGSSPTSSAGVSVFLMGSAVFTDETTYVCTANYTTEPGAPQVSYTSGSVFILTSPSDTPDANYICVGN